MNPIQAHYQAVLRPDISVPRKTGKGNTITGLCRRGQVWWWNFQRDGRRVHISLDTTDHGEVVRKVLEYRSKPQLTEAGRWEFEADKYLREEEQRRKPSPAYAKSRRYVLMRFASGNEIQTPGEIKQRLFNAGTTNSK